MKNYIQILKAVSAAMIGVGKKENLIKDFNHAETSGPWPYIIAGLIFTLIFIFLIIIAVKFTLSVST